ncbi:2-dehydropantoate 2-reductase-like protein [Clohesyomyces aquaticus]|uniref:2-dehydropantoate 2-reductase n=1 Tax=Clohesyomyces aquaticus TaxID=1231657 RepID=A0A1Y1ZKC0_9PLEO|nr:2-dehydropantoate 2-reductase-like protein [Clohesyomyces aquaticus]
MSPSQIHILGLGNLGKLLAHSLRRNHPELPITLLFHRPSLAEEWNQAGQCIEIVRNTKADKQNGFRTEMVSEKKDQIENLVVATKTHSTVQAIQPIRERLRPTSTLLFLQNGIGTIDEATKRLFPLPSSRPNYLAGIFNHGVYATSQFSSVHIGLASAFIGPAPSNYQGTVCKSSQPPAGFLAQKIVECPELNASHVTHQQLLHIQLQKLAVNAVINPLTSIFGCLNGELFQSAAIRELINRVVAEISAVILVILSQQNEPLDHILQERFSQSNLKEVVCEIGEQTAQNISSMRQDYLAGRKTEIDYINGYIVKKGTDLGVQCPANAMIVALVQNKRSIYEAQISDVFFGDSIMSSTMMGVGH